MRFMVGEYTTQHFLFWYDFKWMILCHFVFSNNYVTAPSNDLPCTVRRPTARMQHWKCLKCIFSLRVFKRWTATARHSLARSSQASQSCTCFHPALYKKWKQWRHNTWSYQIRRLLDVPIIYRSLFLNWLVFASNAI